MDSQNRLQDAYVDHLLEHGEPPASVYKFCKDLGIPEAEFFREAASFEVLESEFWTRKAREVIAGVTSGAEWPSFDARQRMLTFLFALTEQFLSMRSLVLLRFEELKLPSRPRWLAGWHGEVRGFCRSVVDHGLETGAIADRGRMSATYPDALVLLTRSVIDYHVKDTSKGFERTDAFIEKSVALAFDLMRTQAIDSAFDLLRFLAPNHKAKPAPPDQQQPVEPTEPVPGS